MFSDALFQKYPLPVQIKALNSLKLRALIIFKKHKINLTDSLRTKKIGFNTSFTVPRAWSARLSPIPITRGTK